MISHHLDAANDRARAMDEEWRAFLEAREQDKRYRFCKFLISSGRLTDHPIDDNATFFRVTRQPLEKTENR